jgi:hypothetical protein
MAYLLLFIAYLFLPSSLSAAPLSNFIFSLDGFIKAAAIYSDSPMASYQNLNLTAPTHALPASIIREQGSRLSFQTQQTRIGLGMNKGPTIGRLEFDFVDFSKASPTTQMVPRVRIASITHRWDQYILIAGQDWDLFSPVGGLAFNYIGNYFLAGNTGFMRPQAIIMQNTPNWEMGMAIGMAGANPGLVDADLERGKSPSYAFRWGHLGSNYRLGMSFIYSALAFYEAEPRRRDAHGQNIYFEQSFSWGELRSEIYYGQNLANLGTLSLGRGDHEVNVREYGGFISSSVRLNERQSILAGAGFARIDNHMALPPFSMRTDETIENLGIRENQVTRIGHEYRINDDLSVNTEATRFKTVSKIAQGLYKRSFAHTIETGLLLRF